MDKKLLFTFMLFIMLFPAYKTFGQMVLTQATASEYIEKILGQGIAYDNAIIVGSPDAIATYIDGTSAGLTSAMENGIILSTGSLAMENTMDGPSSILKSTEMETPGFIELTEITGQPTFDGIMLQFDFIPVTNKIKINFQFGSEEYPEFVGTDYNDVFAFFIMGPGIDGEYNMAVAPTGTPSTRICTSTVNCGDTCPSTGFEGANCSLFIDNCEGDFDNVMDGYTVMLSAQAEVIPCETYTIKLMLADVEDAEHDSWVLLQENGFYSAGAIVDAEINYAYGGTGVVEGCLEAGEMIFSIAEPLDFDHTFEVDWGGTATYGIDYLPLPTVITIPAGETSVIIPVVTFLDDIVEETETIIGIFQKNECEEGEIIIEIHEYWGCCYPFYTFDAPTGDSPQTLVQGQTLAVLFVNGEPGAYFVWYSDSDLTTEIPATTEAVDQMTYYVTQTIEGCESDALAVFVEVTLSNVDFDERSFMAYPNPVNKIFNLSYSNEITGVEVTDMLGQTLISETVNSTDVRIDMSILPTGNYLVKVKADGMVKTLKVVKQ